MKESDLIKDKWYYIRMKKSGEDDVWEGKAKFVCRAAPGYFRDKDVFKFVCEDGMQGAFTLDEIIEPTTVPESHIDKRDKFIHWIKNHITEAEAREDSLMMIVLQLSLIKDKLNELGV